MKNLTKNLSVALTLFMAINFANAQSSEKKDCKDNDGKCPTSAELISKMDSDSDNRLSKEEVKGPLSDHFAEIDTNSDGYLTQVELENAPKPDKGNGERKRPSSEELINKMDENKDGKLALSEVKGPLSDHFTEIDRNADGYITLAELENMPKPDKGNRKKS